MARLGGMSTESFSSARDRLSAASVGLAAILRDQKTMASAFNRSNVFLGLSTQTPPSATSRSLPNPHLHSLATSPAESTGFLDAGDDADDHKEEDMSTDSRNPPSLKDHLGITIAASSHGFSHGHDPPFRHGFSHAYNQQRHSGVVLQDGRNWQMYAADATRYGRHQLGDGSVGIRDGTAPPTVRLISPLSKDSDGQSRLISPISKDFDGKSRIISPLSKDSDGQSSGRASSTPSWAIPCAGRHISHGAARHLESQSAPVDLPNWSKMLNQDGGTVGGGGYGITKVEEDDTERLPPHEMLAREYAQRQTMTSSVCEGQGRTLKGRDMQRMRNEVWRQNGFAD